MTTYEHNATDMSSTYLNDDLSINYKSALFDIKDELKDELKKQREYLERDYFLLGNAKLLINIIHKSIYHDQLSGHIFNQKDSLIVSICKREMPFENFNLYGAYDQFSSALLNHMKQKIYGLEYYITNYESEIDDLVVKIEALSTAIALLDIK